MEGSLGTQKRPPFLSGGWVNGENTSNPLAGPVDTYGFGGFGGVKRPRLASLDDWEHGLGAMRAMRPFNRSVPFCPEGE